MKLEISVLKNRKIKNKARELIINNTNKINLKEEFFGDVRPFVAFKREDFIIGKTLFAEGLYLKHEFLDQM